MHSTVECPCGTVIGSSQRYTLLFLKKELFEIDILCPNEMCYLRELGYVKFDVPGQEARFREASFYPPFVTWNATQLGKEMTHEILKGHLKEIVTNQIKWKEITEVAKRTIAAKRPGALDESISKTQTVRAGSEND